MKMKRTLSLLLTLALLLASIPQIPLTATAATVVASGTCGADGDNLTWTLDDEGTLTISGTGAMMDYSLSKLMPWYSQRASVKKVIIENGVTAIGSSAFYDCTNLTSVTIPDSVTTIGGSAFYDCTNLTSVTIPDSVTTIGGYAFSGCSKLTSVTIPDSVITIGSSAFYNTKWYNAQPNGLVYAGKVAYIYKGPCPSQVTIKEGTHGIAGAAFSNCISLTSVTIPDSVMTIGNSAFYGCRNLTSVTIPDSVTTIGNSAFYNCYSLASVDIGDSVTTIGEDAFRNCYSLTSVTIPNSVTTIGREAFSDCTSLAVVIIPDAVTTIGGYAFSNTAWYNAKPDGLVYAGKVAYKFKGTCPSEITIKDGTKGLAGFVFSNCTTLTSIEIPDSVTNIGNGAFQSCTGLTNVTIPDSVTAIGTVVFSNCRALTSVNIPDSVTTIENGVFENCTSLTSVTIPDFVTAIGNSAFYECTSLTSMDIPDSVTTIGEYAFCGCTGLTSVVIGKKVTNIGAGAFGNCGLTEVTFKGSAPTIEKTAFYNVCSAAFYYADETWTSEMTIDYGGVITWLDISSYRIIASGTCGEGLTWTLDNNCTLTISGTGAMKDYDVSYSMSNAPWCQYHIIVHNLVVKEGVTSIGENSFTGCSYLKNVEIPTSVKYVGEYAFYHCTRLEGVYISDLAAWCGISFDAVKVRGIATPGSNPLYYADYLYVNGIPVIDLVVPNSTTHIGEGTFMFYQALRSVTISDSVTYIENGAFYCCENLEIIEIGSSVDTIREAAIFGNDSLETISVSQDNLHYMSDDGVLFDKKQTTLITYPSSKDSDVYIIPDSVTTIGEEAFSYCRGLTSVTIPNSVTTIGRFAFGYCTGLKEIYFDGCAPAIVSNAFGNVTATAYYYPNETWTEEAKQDYGGTITWVARECTHSYSSVVTPPTCTEQGYTTHTCSVCGNSYKDSYVDATGHSYGDWVEVDDTYHKHTCTVCKTHTESQTHDWDSGTITKQPTCKETGIKTYTCPTCEATKTETVSKTNDHKYSSVVTPPTCTEQGYTTHTCSVCGDSYKDSYVNATGHSYGDWVEADDTYHKHTCTVCKTHSETAKHTFGENHICTDCGYTAYTPGDLNNDGSVDEDDAIYLLQHVLLPNLFPVSQAVDYNQDGSVDEDDAIYLLQHVLLPNLFPIS